MTILDTLDISSLSSTKLAEVIICQRYFNMQVSPLVLQELAVRREKGEEFDFEAYIEEELNKLPVLDTQPVNIKEILKNIKL